ncbi:MAG TPA: trans-aconitate 2-methyltransferase [Pseudonocardiaceae bacterium]|nr:trans-aconitate 2-methyltransferase [Pseudonocardiaceae bacterium]
MWDPTTYLTFADHRGRPFRDLVARVADNDPRRVVDLGCGPGNQTETLAGRWPAAVIEGVDSSQDMVDAARARGVNARLGDVNEWVPEPDTDVVLTNATLQWVPGHQALLSRWAGQLPSGAWLAMQVPGNFDAPSHVLIREQADSPAWRADLAAVLLRAEDVVGTPQEYGDLFADAGCQVDAWETTYLQSLTGADPVLNWVTGTALRPIRAALDDQRWDQFAGELAPKLRAAYPVRADGTTWFEFRRVFAVARTA